MTTIQPAKGPGIGADYLAAANCAASSGVATREDPAANYTPAFKAYQLTFAASPPIK